MVGVHSRVGTVHGMEGTATQDVGAARLRTMLAAMGTDGAQPYGALLSATWGFVRTAPRRHPARWRSVVALHALWAGVCVATLGPVGVLVAVTPVTVLCLVAITAVLLLNVAATIIGPLGGD